MVEEVAIVVGQYLIEGWTIGEEFNNKTGHNMTKVTMTLSRKGSSVAMSRVCRDS